LPDFDPYQRARTQHSPMVLDVVASGINNSIHNDVLSYKNAIVRFLGNTRGIRRNQPDRSYPDRSTVLLIYFADQNGESRETA
jgi:hypothetical protein